MVDKVSPLLRRAILSEQADHRFFAYREGGLGELNLIQPVVLDIDLDYFCWDDSLSMAGGKKLTLQRKPMMSLSKIHCIRSESCPPLYWRRRGRENDFTYAIGKV